MVKQTISWFRRYWNDPNVLALFALLTLVIFIFATLSKILIPVFASIVIAYLLQWAVERLERYMPRRLAVLLVCIGFLALLAVAIIGILPPLWRQLSNLANELPNTIGKGQALLMHLPERYPDYISSSQMQQFLNEFKLQLGRLGQMLLSASITFIPSMIAVVIYLVLVPLLVYFFLMDKNKILQWFTPYLPRNRRLISQVWHEVHAQIGKYIAGKLIEMAIVWVVCFIVFWGMGLQYAMLLSAFVGLSVVVPYIGAVVVTVPVLLIALLQWGWSADFAYLTAAYAVIITLDANVLVPLLFSEAVNLHPVAIIIATLFFGGLWGFWGVFFAIPLAALVQAILHALPHAE